MAFALIQMVIDQLAATFHQPKELAPLEELVKDIQETRDSGDLFPGKMDADEFKQAVDKWVRRVSTDKIKESTQ